jgi:valyl-tRNA synthetase
MTDTALPTTYDFHSVEPEIYAMWESKGYFKPIPNADRDPFVISMPPPNVTGELHLGHAMFVAMEDLLIRHQRMLGSPALWVPGSDHAGIATQLQVERHLLATEELTREEIGREAFEARVWEWKNKYGGIIGQQIRRLGASCDWSRERFTLDEGLSKAVREAFVSLYEKGLIYRGTYLINWSPGLRTAVSDLEVEYSEEQGTLYTFKYPLADSDEFIPVATTRPETILGDTAVAVHPGDERYARFVGRTCLVPMLDRPIPVIVDEHVELEFGTGALKVTPGHDPDDYDIGKRHDLEFINVLNTDATMNENAGPYAGLDRFACREKLWGDMAQAGLTIKTEPYTMQVPRSQRGGEIIEPMISTQWFVKMEPLAKPALEVVRKGEIKIVPERFTKIYYNWLENIRDWCISRQLWWGHRIPAWHCADCGEITVARQDPDKCAHCGSSEIRQDPDVLDTWFSSGLWPFSTLGWPEETDDLAKYYPTSLMETGYDILFFWVARMIMMGLEFTGKAPFHTVYLHGLVRDGDGRKMSKSLGNVIDPLQVMDEFGTDALRFTLLTGSTPGNDMNLSLQRVEANRNFANKLWNAARLVLMAVDRAPEAPGQAPELTPADRWITARQARLEREVDRLLGSYQFGEAGRQVYEFFWSEFADWYLEVGKLQLDLGGERAWLTAKIMVEVLDTCLRLLHPFTPFVTESLWGHLKAARQAQAKGFGPQAGWEDALIVAGWPEAPAETDGEEEDIQAFEDVMAVIRAVRNLRSERGVEPSRQIAAMIQAGDQTELFESQRQTLCALAHIDADRLDIRERLDRVPEHAIPLVVGTAEIFLPSAELFDVDVERRRLQAEMAEIQGQIERLEGLLSGAFAERAPQDVVEKERGRLEDYRLTYGKLQSQIDALG